MANKFLREAREFVRLFFEEYEEDPDLAKDNLYRRLEGKRYRTQGIALQAIEERMPGVLND